MIVLSFILALIFFILTLVLSKKDKTCFLNGIFLTLAIILASLAIYCSINSKNIIDTISFLVRDVIKYITYIVAILFIYNGIYNSMTLKKVRKNNITDLLSFLGGLTLIMFNLLTSNRAEMLYIIIDLLMFYIDIMFVSYIINSLIYRIYTKQKEYDVIIVLGAGLIEGLRPSKTLSKRLNKAIEVYNENANAYIIVSGGKGTNEKVSEAKAMENFLVAKGVDRTKIILEDKSENTYENFKYVKEKLNVMENKSNLKIAFVSSDFHIYRAAIYAKEVKLNADGIGSKTVFYYYPNALIREFAAIFIKYKIGILIYLIFLIILLPIFFI